MRPVQTDVDIDVFGRDNILKGVECIFGRIDRADNKFEKHPTGVYFQNIPQIINHMHVNRTKWLTRDMIGKTFRELGFYFEPFN